MTNLDAAIRALVSIDDVVAGKAKATVCPGNVEITKGASLLVEDADGDAVFATAAGVMHSSLNSVTARQSLDCGVTKPTLETEVQKVKAGTVWNSEVTVVYFEDVVDPEVVETVEVEEVEEEEELDFFGQKESERPIMPTSQILEGLGISQEDLDNVDDTDVLDEEDDD